MFSRSRASQKFTRRLRLEALEDRRLLSGGGAGMHGLHVTETSIITPHESIPRFGAQPTNVAVVSGPWSMPSTWSAGWVPAAGARVRVPEGITVRYDLESQTELDVIEVGGRLEFDPTRDTSLWLNELMVLPSGTLTIGTPESPIAASVTAEIVFTDTPDDSGHHFKTGTVERPGVDPEQFGNGLLAFGTVVMHGAAKTPYVRALEDIESGVSSVIVDQIPHNWNAEDEILLPETSQQVISDRAVELKETETLRLDSIDDRDGIVVLTSPTKSPHLGISANPFGVERYAHLANLTRNVVLRSENPAGVRGHFMATAHAQVDIQNAQFVSLGRTSAEAPVDDTVIDSETMLPVHIGTNQVARYPIHFHHLMGTFQVSGAVVQDGLKWGIVVHESSDGLIEDTVVYDTDGAGIVTESGDETGNVFRRNLIAKVDGGHQKNDKRGGVTTAFDSFGNSFRATGADGSGFWMRSSAGTLEENVVYDAAGYGFNFNGYYRTAESSRDDIRQQVESFRGNEAVSSLGGLWLTWSQGQTPIESYERQVFEDFLAWHVGNDGVHAYHDGNITLRNITVIGNPAVANANQGSHTQYSSRVTTGLAFGNPSYQNFNLRMEDIDVSGVNIGITAPARAGVEGTQLDGARIEAYINIAFAAEADRGSFRLSDVEYLPSQTVRVAKSHPDGPANMWQQGVGVLEAGQLAPGAGAGQSPILPAFIDLREDGRLLIKGGAGEDIVDLIVVADQLVVTVNGREFAFALAAVGHVYFWGYDGDDRFINRTDLAGTAFGGQGNDYLKGGGASDSLLGGSGNDIVIGGAGDDTIYGDSGDDWLFGAEGRDKLRGGEGNDSLYGEADIDLLLFGGDGDDSVLPADSAVDGIFTLLGDEEENEGDPLDLLSAIAGLK